MKFFGEMTFAFVLLIGLAVIIAFFVLCVLLIKALVRYIKSKDVREEKAVIKKSLGEVLKQHREECKMTQEFVAEAIGVSRQAVSKWENGVSLRLRYHINPTLTFAQPIQPEGWITRKGGMRPVEG